MINIKYLFYFIFLMLGFTFSFSQTYSTLKLSRADDKLTFGNGGWSNTPCESRVKVVDIHTIPPTDCWLTYPYVLYPVIYEEFDFKEELPNNWAFNYGYTSDDDYDLKDNGHLWMGSSENAYDKNVTVYGGSAHLLLKKEDTNNQQAYNDPVNAKVASFKNYRFSASALTSRFKTRQGLVKVVAKFPENNLLWLGLWKRGDKQEIDIIEAWDDEPDDDNCDTYHQMKMHIHNTIQHPYNTTNCVRGRKFKLASGFYSNYHKYVCDFTDYRIDFALDDELVGYANKYYEGLYLFTAGCNKDAESGIPSVSHGCNSIHNLIECLWWFDGTLQSQIIGHPGYLGRI